MASVSFFQFLICWLPNTYQQHSSEPNSSWLVASIPGIRISRHLGLAPIWCALSTHLSLGEMWSETADHSQMYKFLLLECVSPCVVSTRPAISQCKGNRFREPNEHLLICGCGCHKVKIYLFVIGRVFQVDGRLVGERYASHRYIQWDGEKKKSWNQGKTTFFFFSNCLNWHFDNSNDGKTSPLCSVSIEISQNLIWFFITKYRKFCRNLYVCKFPDDRLLSIEKVFGWWVDVWNNISTMFLE